MLPDADLLHRLADAASAETLPRFRSGLVADDKEAGATPAHFDPVTEADRAAERAVRAVLAEARPEDGVLGEEYPETPGTSGRRWVIDPVDGTRAYVCGVPVWTSLIGLEAEGAPVLGVIEQPFTAERWSGGAGVPATYRRGGADRPARTSRRTALAEARLMVTDLRCAPGAYLSEPQAAALGRLAAACRLTRQGLDSYAFGLLAMGQLDLVCEAGLGWHDVAGVIPVIEAAGGTVTDWAGGPPRAGWDGTMIAAASEGLAAAARGMLTA